MPLSAPTQILPALLSARSAPARRRTPAPAEVRHPRSMLVARCREWVSRLGGAEDLREIEPRLARDMGVAAGCDRCPASFAVDPRPLWGIGLTPQPAALPSRDSLWP